MIGLAPGVTTTLAGSTWKPRRCVESFGDRLAQHGQAERRAVVGPAVVERLLGRVADVHRRVEVGLADLEVDDVVTLRLPRAGARRSLERGLGADADHALRELHRADASRARCLP